MPIIPATQEVKIGGIEILDQSEHKVSWVWWHMPVIPATWEALGRRITV
jgi:hypothetical protein